MILSSNDVLICPANNCYTQIQSNFPLEQRVAMGVVINQVWTVMVARSASLSLPSHLQMGTYPWGLCDNNHP